MTTSDILSDATVAICVYLHFLMHEIQFNFLASGRREYRVGGRNIHTFMGVKSYFQAKLTQRYGLKTINCDTLFIVSSIVILSILKYYLGLDPCLFY